MDAQFLKEYFEKFEGDELQRIMKNENVIQIKYHHENEMAKRCLQKSTKKRSEEEVDRLTEHFSKFKFF